MNVSSVKVRLLNSGKEAAILLFLNKNGVWNIIGLLELVVLKEVSGRFKTRTCNRMAALATKKALWLYSTPRRSDV